MWNNTRVEGIHWHRTGRIVKILTHSHWVHHVSFIIMKYLTLRRWSLIVHVPHWVWHHWMLLIIVSAWIRVIVNELGILNHRHWTHLRRLNESTMLLYNWLLVILNLVMLLIMLTLLAVGGLLVSSTIVTVVKRPWCIILLGYLRRCLIVRTTILR